MLNVLKRFINCVITISLLIYLLVFVPTIWGQNPLVILSSSMEPNLSVGGILYYQKENIHNFKVNDVLVYRTKEHIVSHRIVECFNDGFLTKGDANLVVDSFVSFDQVMGKGTDWSIPWLGYYTNFLYTHKYIIYLSILVLFFDSVRVFYQQNKRKVGGLTEKKL